MQQGYAPAGITAGVADPFGVPDAVSLAGVQFGHAENPVRVRPVGDGGIDDPGLRVVDQRHRLARSVFGQAENGQIGTVQHLSPGRRVLAGFLGQAESFQVIPPLQPLLDLQAGGAFLAVDEYFCRHVTYSWAAPPIPSPGRPQFKHKQRKRAFRLGTPFEIRYSDAV